MDKATRTLIGNLNVLIYSQQINAVVLQKKKKKKTQNILIKCIESGLEGVSVSH